MFKPLKAAAAAGLALMMAASTYSNVGAQAYTTQYITSITYQNVGTDAAQVSLNFYAEGSGTATAQSLPDIAANAGTAFYVGNASNLAAGFKGAAVLSSSQPIIATMVQVPQNSPARNRPLSNGFDTSAGAANVRIATVLKNTFDQNTQFSVQNVDSVANNLEVKFINADPNAGAIGSVVKTETLSNLPTNSVKYYDAATVAGMPSSFSGSVTIKATRGDGSDGKVVATALELNITGTGASAFEGLASDANKLYMPSAICDAFGGQRTAYAVQNTSTTADAAITVTYSYRSANAAAGDPFQTITDAKTVAPGAKASFVGCNVMPANSNGSAVITSTGANIVAIGKVFGAGLSTAAPGAASGGSRIALPYTRFSQTKFDTGERQRTFIAIQNVGAAELAAGSVTVKYLDKNGATVGTHTLGAIPAAGKVSSNPTLASGDATALAEFGYYTDGSFGGSAVVEGPSGSTLVVVARVQTVGTGEDYNGMPIQ